MILKLLFSTKMIYFDNEIVYVLDFLKIVTLLKLWVPNVDLDMILILCECIRIIYDHIWWLETSIRQIDAFLWKLLNIETLVIEKLHMVMIWWIE